MNALTSQTYRVVLAGGERALVELQPVGRSFAFRWSLAAPFRECLDIEGQRLSVFGGGVGYADGAHALAAAMDELIESHGAALAVLSQAREPLPRLRVVPDRRLQAGATWA